MSIYSILGAGNGGQALAAILKAKGNFVKLWNRSDDKIKILQNARNIQLTGMISLNSKIDILTSNIEEAINASKIIFVVVPANAHKNIAELISPYIKENQAIVLNPGRTAGVLEFKNTLIKNGCKSLPIICETQSLFCACRLIDNGKVNILSFKKDNIIAGIPKIRYIEIQDDLNEVYNNLTIARSTLNTSMENIGAILHPTPVLLNTGWIESRDVFFPHYYYGISKSIADFLERMDNERINIAKEFDISTRSVKRWHEDNYGVIGNNLYETLQKNSSYASIDAPRSLNSRYIYEDIPTGLVPLSEIGKAVGVKTPLMDMIIDLANYLLKTDFRLEGRNLVNLGLFGKNRDEIKMAFEE